MKDTNTGFCQNHVMHYEQRCPECHDESVLAALRGEPSIVVEEFDTEIIHNESGIEVGETSTKLPVLDWDAADARIKALQGEHS